MKNKLTTFVLLLVVAFVGLGSTKCSQLNDSWNDEVRKSLNYLGISNEYSLPRKYTYRTAKGAIVESTKPVPQVGLDALDRGFQRRMDRFRIMFPNWPVPTTIARKKVIFIDPNVLVPPPGDPSPPSPPCRLESIPNAPCFYVKGIKTAGTVVGVHDLWDKIDLDPAIVLPHQHEGGWQWLDYLAAAAHNEDEHYAGWFNRRNDPTGVFYRFMGANDVHPWQWGEIPVPLFNDSLDQLIQDIPHTCLPALTKDELEKIADELGVNVNDLGISEVK